jgi:outer membrane protein assembly factor BamB
VSREVLRCAAACAAVAAVIAGSSGPVGAAAPPPRSAWTTFGASTNRNGYSPIAVAQLGRAFVLPVDGRVTSQVLAADGLFFATTNGGEVVAFDANGFVRWRQDVGQLAHDCGQLDGYGVVGTGVIDARAHTLYVVDAFARMHAFALANGAERPGWPIRLFPAFTEELDWGALTLAGGSVYVPGAAYCDIPLTLGGVHAIDLGSRAVAHWRVVSTENGGGGGPWGWGGLAFDPQADALYVGTSGAFPGGANDGDDFTESIGVADRLVELSPDLTVQTSSHPPNLPDKQDLDFVGSPLLVETPVCGKLAIAATKNDTVYSWQRNDIAAGPIWTVPIEPYDIANPFVGQLAWSPRTASVYAVTGTQLVRIAVDKSCEADLVWRRPLGTNSLNGSPTVAGNTVWFADNKRQALVGYNATTGAKVFSAPLGGIVVQAPTVVRGRVVVGTFTGMIEGFSTPSGNADRPLSPGPRSTSWADSKNGWQRRDDGVYATTNGGQGWRRIYDHPALSIALLGPGSGVISTGSEPRPCMCATRQLLTTNNGATWRTLAAITGSFLTGAGRVYYWENRFDKSVLRVVTPVARSSEKRLGTTTLATITDGTIAGAARTAGGLVALLSNRHGGQGWDNAPRVIVVKGSSATTVSLPRQEGFPLAQRIEVAGQTVTVTGADFTEQPARNVTWVSRDGAATWTALSTPRPPH